MVVCGPSYHEEGKCSSYIAWGPHVLTVRNSLPRFSLLAAVSFLGDLLLQHSCFPLVSYRFSSSPDPSNMKVRQLLSRQRFEDSFMPRKHVPWIDTPLETDGHGEHGHGHVHGENRLHVPHEGSKMRIRENSEHMLNNDVSSDEHHPEKYHHVDDTPKFKKHHEASSIELFYDLFFVANLATFTANAEIADAHSECAGCSAFCGLGN